MKLTLALIILAFAAFLIFRPSSSPNSPSIPETTSSSRSPSSGSHSSNLPSPTQLRNISNHDLKSAIETECAKLNDRTDNRELPILIAHLRELGRREGLQGIEFIDQLFKIPDSTGPLFINFLWDESQAKIAVYAGWGIADPAAAANHYFKSHSLFFQQTSPMGMGYVNPIGHIARPAIDLANAEIVNRWKTVDPEGYDSTSPSFRENFQLASSISNYPVDQQPTTSPFHVSFNPALTGYSPRDFEFSAGFSPSNLEFNPAMIGSPNANIVQTDDNTLNGQLNLPGHRSFSTLEWASRNSDLARDFLQSGQLPSDQPDQQSPSLEIPAVAAGLAITDPDYQTITAHLSPPQLKQTIDLLIKIAAVDHTQEAWPVDARPAIIQLPQTERISSLSTLINSAPSLTNQERATYRQALTDSLHPPTE